MSTAAQEAVARRLELLVRKSLPAPAQGHRLRKEARRHYTSRREIAELRRRLLAALHPDTFQQETED